MERDAIEREVGSIETMGAAIRWVLGRSPAAEFLDVVAQDEFTLDVIVRVGPATYVVFDTT